jgi:acetyltransferase-like isoleucine patch superfamily enzyme
MEAVMSILIARFAGYILNVNKILLDILNLKLAKYNGLVVGESCRLINVNFGVEPYLVKIGNHVSITKSSFETHDGGVWNFRDIHPSWDVIKPINIGDNVYIGTGCIILAGVNIGDNVIIGAGAVVTKSLESGFVYAGVPARKVKSIEEYYMSVAKSKLDTKHFSADEKKRFLLELYS